jgi:HPt (histidine-containing phosphotransfer) domain-containing protein
MTLQDQLRVLIERNHTKLLEQVASVAQLLAERDREGNLEPAPLVEAQRLTHQMRGAAGSIGFGEIGAAAAALDENLKVLCKGSGAVPGNHLQPSLVLLAALRTVAGRTKPETSTLYNADLSRFAR